jgi:hypothetical protein
MATGSMVKVAQKMIEKEFKGFGLCSVTMVKPFDIQAFNKYTSDSNLIISLGGLFKAIFLDICTFLRKAHILNNIIKLAGYMVITLKALYTKSFQEVRL